MNNGDSALLVKVYFDSLIVVEPYHLRAARRRNNSLQRHSGRTEPKPSVISGWATEQIFDLLKCHAGSDCGVVLRMKSPMEQSDEKAKNNGTSDERNANHPEISLLPARIAHGLTEPRKNQRTVGLKAPCESFLPCTTRTLPSYNWARQQDDPACRCATRIVAARSSRLCRWSIAGTICQAPGR